MRAVILILVAIFTVAGVGRAVCLAAGFSPHMRELIAAGIASALASALAMVPMLLTHEGASQATTAQSGLVGTLVHLFGHVIVAAAVLLARIPLEQAFVYWLLAFYWGTLIAITALFVTWVRRMPSAAARERTRE